ncbi:hypothetical protein COO91_02326 [Nostoc flagelliforme CCNUN1]|uniref:Uncharacterized protein n=1 Tax=Nostoc flagelliforme CCNUN1 TaxID=2038116 RepID=A0A2K8SLR4_9NOSO|nr:hypothetical protein COO91_02326 [Nostoc flagelliforme CCNUN1]
MGSWEWGAGKAGEAGEAGGAGEEELITNVQYFDFAQYKCPMPNEK